MWFSASSLPFVFSSLCFDCYILCSCKLRTVSPPFRITPCMHILFLSTVMSHASLESQKVKSNRVWAAAATATTCISVYQETGPLCSLLTYERERAACEPPLVRFFHAGRGRRTVREFETLHRRDRQRGRGARCLGTALARLGRTCERRCTQLVRLRQFR